VLTAPLVPELKKLGIRSVNLSLDTLDRERFFAITRRDELPVVLHTLEQLLEHGMHVKMNAVVMDGRNTDDIIPLAAMTRGLPVDMRFIEEMPFNGDSHLYTRPAWDHVRILETLRGEWPSIKKIPDGPYSTSANYRVPGHKGTIGIIAAYSRTFCGTCNRIRLTPQGQIKTCLYDDGVLNIKDLIRSGQNDAELQASLLSVMGRREKDGWEAEKNRKEHLPAHESMATIGG
jgi:cyclic pyranopterin phosphate synthase